MKKNGQSGASYDELMAHSCCADLLLLERAYAAMPVPSPAALVTTLEGLGAGLLSGNAPSNFLGPRQHDGLAAS